MQPDHVVINELEIITERFLRKVHCLKRLYLIWATKYQLDMPVFLVSQSWTRLELVKFSAVYTGRFFGPKVGSFFRRSCVIKRERRKRKSIWKCLSERLLLWNDVTIIETLNFSWGHLLGFRVYHFMIFTQPRLINNLHISVLVTYGFFTATYCTYVCMCFSIDHTKLNHTPIRTFCIGA